MTLDDDADPLGLGPQDQGENAEEARVACHEKDIALAKAFQRKASLPVQHVVPEGEQAVVQAAGNAG